MVSGESTFRLSDYDAIGFDFDNTLVQYNLSNLFQLHYSYLINFLVANKGYHGLNIKMDNEDIDFIRRGLFLDFKRGNIIDISSEGIIINASHGKKKLSIEQIADIYGQNLKWSVLDPFVTDKLALWESPASEETRTFLDYSDTTCTLVFAKIIDFLDERGESDYVNAWPHLLEAIVDMYKPDSYFSRKLISNMMHYIHKCEPNVIDLLKKLKKKGSKLLLITGSDPSTVNPMAEYAIGSNWESLFDTIVYCAKKPKFFTGDQHFLDINSQPVTLATFQGKQCMRGGSWTELYKNMEAELGRPAKCIYLGDSTIQDVYAPSVAIKPIDSIAVMDEVLADGHFEGEHAHAKYVRSQFWGPYFGKRNKTTIMGDLIIKLAKLCIPSIAYLANKPLEYEHVPFWHTDT